jgi:phosphatidylglycerophosphatase A
MAIDISKITQKYKNRRQPIPEKVFTDWRYFMAFGLGSGAIPIAPGTFGTLMAIPFYLLLQPLPIYIYLTIVILFCIASAILSDQLSKEIHIHDHPGMCIDEFAGFFVTMIAAPSGFIWILLGFLLFRLFDIWKPWPISIVDEKVHGGFGMILDDVLAGIYALIIIQIINQMVLAFFF